MKHPDSYPISTIFRFQWALVIACLVLGMVYFSIFKPLSLRAVKLDQSLAKVRDKLVDANLKNHARVGLNLESVNQSVVLAEKALATLRKEVLQAKERIELEPEYREKMRQPFYVLDFTQKRVALITELRGLAASKNVTLEPAILASYPDSDSSLAKDNPSLLWAQMAIVHYVLITAANYGPMTVKSVALLPAQSHAVPTGERKDWMEFPIRVGMAGSMEAIVNFLLSLPLLPEELKKLNYAFVPSYKPALFINRLILKSTPANPNEAILEAVVSGFYCQESSR